MRIRDIARLEKECANLNIEIDMAVDIASKAGLDRISITMEQADRIQRVARGYGKYLAMVSSREVDVYA